MITSKLIINNSNIPNYYYCLLLLLSLLLSIIVHCYINVAPITTTNKNIPNEKISHMTAYSIGLLLWVIRKDLHENER